VASNDSTAQHHYTFRITLLGVTPPVWRLLACPATQTLATFHTVIQAAMGWKRAHPYEFEIAAKMYREPNGAEDEKSAGDPRDTRLEQLDLAQGATVTYLYDKGDDWVHQIIVEGVAPSAGTPGLPLLLGGAGACPPEGSGGPGGYIEALRAARRPDSEEGKAALTKLGGAIDPAAWSPADAAQALADLAPQAAPAAASAAAPPAAPAPSPPQQHQGGGKRGKRRR
jgi:hypothetical protein